ncbi:MAG: tRNA pseudouridine(55) synthase TruB [Actinobacteria bacterium]|nr:MAG: tRNA pseudouridine(55) synthase TruB [Actinomycetota bacterium]
MRSRRGATDLAGILPIDKPQGPTSHDVVSAVRRATGEGRVGHAGTLDPLATGLLVVLVGPYTRLERFLSAEDKSYTARFAFGAETDTDDSEGTVTRYAPVPDDVFDPVHAAEVLAGFTGEIEQVPPAYSALKTDGRIAHRAARAGEPLDLAPRRVVVHEAALTAVDADARTWDVTLRVSKGTYVRALARDLGRACGSAAHVSALRRTASGALAVEQAHTIDEVVAAGRDAAPLFADPLAALGLAAIEGDPDLVRQGRPLPVPAVGATEGERFAVTCDGTLAAVYRMAVDRLLPEAVIRTAT